MNHFNLLSNTMQHWLLSNAQLGKLAGIIKIEKASIA